MAAEGKLRILLHRLLGDIMVNPKWNSDLASSAWMWENSPPGYRTFYFFEIDCTKIDCTAIVWLWRFQSEWDWNEFALRNLNFMLPDDHRTALKIERQRRVRSSELSNSRLLSTLSVFVNAPDILYGGTCHPGKTNPKYGKLEEPLISRAQSPMLSW